MGGQAGILPVSQLHVSTCREESHAWHVFLIARATLVPAKIHTHLAPTRRGCWSRCPWGRLSSPPPPAVACVASPCYTALSPEEHPQALCCSWSWAGASHKAGAQRAVAQLEY